MAYTVTVTENPTTVTVSADTVVIPSTNNVDNSFAIVDETDPTKKLMFSVGSQAAASTLTITLPALAASQTLNLPLITATDTLPAIGLAQTWTATQTFAGINATSIGATTPGTGVFTSVTNSALTSGRVAIVSTGGLMADDAGLTFTPASDLLVINHNAAALPAIPNTNDTVVQVGGLDTTNTKILIDSFAGIPQFTGRYANGTNGSKSAVTSGNAIAALVGLGYGTSQYTTGAAGSIQIQGNETWSDTAAGTKIVFLTTPTGGSLTQATRFTIAGASAVFASGVPVTMSDTTNSTSAGTGAIITSGGIGVAKNITFNGTTGASLRIVTATANGSVATTLGSVGPTGAQTTVQGWFILNVAGTDRYIPFW